jgi:hypothetical protein
VNHAEDLHLARINAVKDEAASVRLLADFATRTGTGHGIPVGVPVTTSSFKQLE